MDPATSLLALLALLAFAASAWGWGRFVLRVCRLEPGSGIGYPIALGLAALAAAGGWLNLLHVAYPPVLWTLLLAGWIAASTRLGDARAALRNTVVTGQLLLPALLIALVAVFLSVSLLPSAVFSPEDDLQMYFPRPVRMLQTGTLGGDLFDPLGLDSLGAAAFLQGFTLLVAAPNFLNALDAVFCATLTLVLLVSIAHRVQAHFLVILAALCATVLLHPQQINISSMYSIAAVTLALVPAAAAVTAGGTPAGAELWRRAIPAGLLIAALPALKLSTPVFVASAGIFLIAGIAASEGWRMALRAAGSIAAAAAIFLLPWILLHGGRYSRMVQVESGGLPEPAGDPARLISGVELYWGATATSYNVVAVFILVVAAAAIIHHWRAGGRHRPEALGLVALCAAAAATYIPNAIYFGVEPGTRYNVPGLLAALGSAVLLAGGLLSGRSDQGAHKLLLPVRAAILVVAVPAAMVFLFSSALAQRIYNAAVRHMVVSFPDDDGVMADYTAWATGPQAARLLRTAQARTLSGERILAMVSYPHHLYFARNPISVASEFGLQTAWLDLPLDADGLQMQRFLRARGVRYVIWQTANGRIKDEVLYLLAVYPGELRPARYMLSFRRSLSDLVGVSKIAYRDDSFVVMDLAQPR